MMLQQDHTFENYIQSAQETVRNLLVADGPLINALRLNHDFFAKTLWADNPDIDPIAGVLGANSFMLLLAGIHTAMTGHANAIFPVLRTGLEYACYAFAISEEPSLAYVWINRHKNAESRKLSRNKFRGAVTATAQRLNALQPESGDIVLDAYEAAIDYGGHPNPLGVLRHLSWGEPKVDEHQEVRIGGLYGSDHSETERALIACLDFGLAIAIVLTRCRIEVSEEVISKLNALNEEKERVVRELGWSLRERSDPTK